MSNKIISQGWTYLRGSAFNRGAIIVTMNRGPTAP